MNCQMLPPLSCRYSFMRRTPNTVAVLPLFSQKHIPQHRSASDTACQFLPGCESFNKPILPPGTHHQGNTHGQEKIPNIRIVIIIIISIRLIYIYLFCFILACFFLLSSWPFLIHKKKVFICDGVMVYCLW